MERVLEGAAAIDIPESLLSSAVGDEPMAADYNFIFFRVPAHIRERNKLLYEPQMVAIGPYGRSDDPAFRGMERVKPSLRAMEQLKRRYLQSFCSRNPYRSIEDYVAEIRKLEPRARGCYFEPVELSAEMFVEMLLLDGCFIVEFLIKWNQADDDSLFASDWSLPLIRGDLLLLENQIPLFVLEKLFELVTSAMDDKIPFLMELLVNYLASRNVESSNEEAEGNHELGLLVPGEAKDFHHLLHLYYRCYVATPQTDPTGSTICGTILKWLRPSRIFALLLSCIRFKICRTDVKTKRFPRTIPSATELLEAGVTIKKKKTNYQNQQRLSSFLDVAYHDGVLEIPFLSVENSTLSRFMNLVAFEQCGGCKPEEAYMTSYAKFMDCLIDKPEDAVMLHQSGILENNLASDMELVVFFNELSNSAAAYYKNHYLDGLFREVGKYCDSDWAKWRAKMVRAYFGNSWAILSLLAALLALVLTFLQTLYTIYPSHHPGN